MYMVVIDPTFVNSMYQIREKTKREGGRLPIAKQIREAIAEYIIKKTSK